MSSKVYRRPEGSGFTDQFQEAHLILLDNYRECLNCLNCLIGEARLTPFELPAVVTTKAPRPDRDGKQRYLISRRVSTEASPHRCWPRSDLPSFPRSRYLSISFSSKRRPSPNLLSLVLPASTFARIDLLVVLNLRLLLPLTPLKTRPSCTQSPSSRWVDSTVSSTSMSILQHSDSNGRRN